MWTLLMYMGPLLGVVAFAGIPLRVLQLLNGDLRRQYRRLVAWGKAVVILGAASSPVVLGAAGVAVHSVHSHLTCDSGGGCAQGEITYSSGSACLAWFTWCSNFFSRPWCFPWLTLLAANQISSGLEPSAP